MEKIINLIPKEELEDKLKQTNIEIDYDFLCFEDTYQTVASIIPKTYTILDLGSYMAAQSYFFKDFNKYIAVDNFDINADIKRFTTENTRHYKMNIKDYLKTNDFKNLDINNVYVICSGVPNTKLKNLLYEIMPNILITFPGANTLAKGIKSNEILNILNNNKIKKH